MIYGSGPPTANQIVMKEGYSKTVLLKPVPQAMVKDNVDLDSFVDSEVQHFAIVARLDDLRRLIWRNIFRDGLMTAASRSMLLTPMG